jgi:ABC-type glycerol-3-phosphate transport system substrate-binding protein
MIWIRRFSFFVLALAGGIFLILGSREKQDAPQDFVIVEYWEKWVGTEAAQMQQIVDDFNNTVGKDRKIFVRYMSMTDVDQKTLVATSAGVPPDIAGLYDQQVAQYAALGAVEPLDDLAAAHGITEQTYLPVFWKGCHYNGRLYALVSTPGTIALFYNKQIFKENADALHAAGLSSDAPPATIDDLDRCAAILDQKNAQGRTERLGYDPLQSWYVPFNPYWFGDNLFDAATGQLTLDSPGAVHCFQWIAGYSKRLGLQTLMDYQQNGLVNFDSPQNLLLIGKLVMQQQGPWMANYVDHLNPSMSHVLVPKSEEWKLKNRADNYAWGVAPFPSAVPGLENVSYSSFDVLMIPKGARHPDEAFAFIAYVNRQDVSEKLNMLHCKNCQLAHVSSNFIQHHPNPYIKLYQDLAASPNAHGVPQIPIWPEVFKELNDDSQSVALEGADPAAVLHQAQQRMQERYDRFHRIEIQRRQTGTN